MYGLPHVGLIARELLEKRLAEAEYFQDSCTPGLWYHNADHNEVLVSYR